MAGCVSKVIYQPQRAVRHTPAVVKLPYEDIVFQASDGTVLSGWWVPAEEGRGTVLFCHGNGGNIAGYLDTVLTGNRLGLNVFIFDYRGYGKSRGSPSEQGTYDDAEAAWEYLVRQKQVPPEKIVVWGRSLGGPIAARTAARHPSGPVILESTFTSLHDLVDEKFGWFFSFLVLGYPYETEKHLEKIHAPVLIVHSPDDEMVPYGHGRKLYEAAGVPKRFLEIRGAHNSGFLDSKQAYESSINDFLTTYLPAKEPESK
jgi:pimeloyl-ACP methyl ester carboxylesterase